MEESYLLHNTISASIKHMLLGCKTALMQGHYRWWSNQVLRKLAEVLETCPQPKNTS